MSQITFPVILLFSFRKCERSVALRTRDFEVWHRGFSTRGNRGRSPSLLFGALASRFFQPRSYGAKALFLKHYAEKLRVPTGLLAASVLQRIGVFNYFVWRDLVRKFPMCGTGATPRSGLLGYTRFPTGTLVAQVIDRSMDQPDIRAPDF